jgi:hypothetical protein
VVPVEVPQRKGVSISTAAAVVGNIVRIELKINYNRKIHYIPVLLVSFIMRDQGSISSTFDWQLLQLQITKAQKKTVKLSIFFALSRSARTKAARRMSMKMTPGGKTSDRRTC